MPIKVAAAIMDIYSDPTSVVARKLPEDCHSLKVADLAEVEALHDHQFGLVMKTASGIQRRLPLHNDDSIKLSRAYFSIVEETMHPDIAKVAKKKLEKPADFDVAYVDVTKLSPAQKKVAFADRCWGLTIDSKNCFPLHDATLVKTAIHRFPSTMIELEPQERFLYARNISKRASALNVPLPAESPVNLYTGGAVNLTSLSHAIEQRKEAVGRSIGTEILDQLSLASGCEIKRGEMETDDSFQLRQIKAASIRPIQPDRIIGVLQNFDKLAGFGSEKYLRGLLDPFAACFKKADCEGQVLIDGIDLSKVYPEMLSDQFDDEFIQAFKANPAQVYMSLPDPVKQIIRGIAENGMSGNGPQRGGLSTFAPPQSPQAQPLSAGDPTLLLNPVPSNPMM